MLSVDTDGAARRGLRGRRSLGRPQAAAAPACEVQCDAPPCGAAPYRPVFAGAASLSMSAVGGARRRQPAPLMTLAAAAPAPPPPKRKVNAASLLLRRPLALLSLVPTELAMFVAGGVAGAIAKTTTAPLDRVKILLQVSSVNSATTAAAKAAAKGGLISTFLEIGKSEGIRGYWRGNIPQVLRVLPYSACQLYSYEKLKKLLADKDGNLSVPARLAAGAGAACMSTIVTYPLDIIRFRMAVDPTLNTIPQVVRAVIRDEGVGAFYKGLLPSCIGIAPYSSINFAAFDLLKKALPEDMAGHPSAVFICSLTAAALATGGCYPLDTIRRQMQLKSSTHANVLAAAAAIVSRDGVGGLYRGFLPNAAKNLPNSSIRLSTFDAAKRLIARGRAAMDAEMAALDAEDAAAAKAAAAAKKGGKAKR